MRRVALALVLLLVPGCVSAPRRAAPATTPRPSAAAAQETGRGPAPEWVSKALLDDAAIVGRVRVGLTYRVDDGPVWARCALLTRLARSVGAVVQTVGMLRQSGDSAGGGGVDELWEAFRASYENASREADPENPVCPLPLTEDEVWVSQNVEGVETWFDESGRFGTGQGHFAVGRISRAKVAARAGATGVPLANRIAGPAERLDTARFKNPGTWVSGTDIVVTGYRTAVGGVGPTLREEDGEGNAGERACFILAKSISQKVSEGQRIVENNDYTSIKEASMWAGVSAYVGCQIALTHRDKAARHGGRDYTYALAYVRE